MLLCCYGCCAVVRGVCGVCSVVCCVWCGVCTVLNTYIGMTSLLPLFLPLFLPLLLPLQVLLIAATVKAASEQIQNVQKVPPRAYLYAIYHMIIWFILLSTNTAKYATGSTGHRPIYILCII